ncbi:zinc finger protein ZPR1-like [Artemia franciscana]
MSMFKPLSYDDEELDTTEISSLCMNCGDNGITRLLLTQIPFYKSVILMSFECEHCGYKNNELQSAEKIQEKGVKYEVKIKEESDLNRQVVKSDSAVVCIPELDFEIPAQSQKGEITTVESLLARAVAGLEQDQPARRALDPESATAIDAFIERLKQCKNLENSFTVVIDDPSGNSFFENPHAPQKDPNMNTCYYTRTKDQDHSLGIYEQSEITNDPVPEEEETSAENLSDEVLTFQTNCPTCNAPCQTNMKVTNIPFFKEVTIMATNCDNCGHRTNEVKPGGGVAEKGTRISLRITDVSDFSRDVLKSDDCSFSIPELEFEVGSGILCGRFTTLEGLLVSIKELIITNDPLISGDSAKNDIKLKVEEFSKKLDDVLACKIPVHIVLDDPSGNSYIQNYYAPEPDPEMNIDHYERSFEQNEELGLNDMKVEGYEEF